MTTKPTIDEQLDKILYGYSGAHAKDDGQMDFYDSEDEYGEALFAAHTEAKQALEALLTEARIDELEHIEGLWYPYDDKEAKGRIAPIEIGDRLAQLKNKEQ